VDHTAVDPARPFVIRLCLASDHALQPNHALATQRGFVVYPRVDSKTPYRTTPNQKRPDREGFQYRKLRRGGQYGRTDDTEALQSTIDAAVSFGVKLFTPTGGFQNINDTLKLLPALSDIVWPDLRLPLT
jgi:hypothetical protein